ncbi:MAG: tetratricopeptide repeat protein [Candidatus Omnitrophota bacterium]
MKQFTFPGNYAIVVLGCKQCPENYEHEVKDGQELCEQIKMIGKVTQCPECQTRWVLKNLNILGVVQDGRSACWKVTPEFEPLNLGDGLTQIKLYEMLVPDMEPAKNLPCEVSNEEHFDKFETTADVLDHLGMNHLEKDEYSQAISCLEAATTAPISEQSDPETRVMHIFHLGCAYEDHGKYRDAASLKKARRTYQAALALGEKTFGCRDIRIAYILDSLANINTCLKEDTEAVSLYKRSLAIRLAKTGAQDTAVVDTMNNLALVYFTLEQYPKAKEIFCQALSILEKAHEKGTVDLPGVMNNLALTLTGIGDKEEGLHVLERAVQIEANVNGAFSQTIIPLLQNLGGLWVFSGNNAKAEQIFSRAIRLAELQPEQDKTQLRMLIQKLKSIKSGRFAKRLSEFWPSEFWQMEA